MDNKSVRLYPPIRARLEELKIPNFNYLVNKLLGEMLGVNPQVIEAYKRDKEETDDNDRKGA